MKMAAFEDAKMEQFKDRPWNSLPENLDEIDTQITTGMTKETNSACQESSSMKLRKEDMILYGLCPAQDEFFLAICERCKLLVKPQALKTHIAIRHCNTEDRKSKITPPIATNHTIKNNFRNQSELFKNPKDYLGTKYQPSSTRHVKRSNAFGKDSNGLLNKNSKVSVTPSKNSCMNSAPVKEDLLPSLLGVTDHSEKRLLSSILQEKPYVDIARMDSEIMNLMSAMEESSSENTKTSDVAVLNGNDSQPPKLEPMMKVESHEKMKEKISIFSSKLFSNQHLELASSIAKKLHTASILLSNKNGKLPSTARMENKKNSDSSPEVKALPQPLIQLNLQNLRPLLSKTVIAHPSILAIKKANASTRQSAATSSATTTSSSQPPSLIHPSSSLIQKSLPTSTVALSSHSFQRPKTILTRNKSSPSIASSGRTSKKKTGNPDYALCKNRQYDPDKHCGVLITETQKPCTRFLTCKTHPLLLRRAVHGRRKPFDELLREQREKRQALARGGSGGKDLQTISPVFKIDDISKTSSTIHIRSLFAANKTGPVLLAACPNKPHQKPNHLPLNPVGNSDSLLKLLPDQSPMEDVFSGLLSPSGMLLSPCGMGLPLFSPESSGNFENFTKLKCEPTEETDLVGFQTSECTMPSLIPFEMKEEDVSWQDVKFSPLCGVVGQMEMNRVVKQQPFRTYSDTNSQGSIDEILCDKDCDEVFSYTRNGLEVMDHHPRPIEINHFNSSLYGDGNYVFTRRGGTCRAALMSAVEPETVVNEPPKKKLRLYSTTFKSPTTTDNQQSSNISQHQSLDIRIPQQDLYHKISHVSSKISGIQSSIPNPSLAVDMQSQPRKLEVGESSASFQCPSLPHNVTLTKSNLITTSKSSSSSLTPIKKQISLTPLNISQITASLKANSNQVSMAAATTTSSTKGGHMVHLAFQNSGIARSLFTVTTNSPPITVALPINKNQGLSMALSKGAGTVLVQPPASQLPVLSPSATVILATSKGMNQHNIVTNFALQNSPETILQLLPRVQNGSRMAKKPTPIILANKNKIGSMDLVSLGLRPPNVLLSSSGASLSSSSSSLSSLTSVVNFSNPGICKSSGQVQNLVLRSPNGVLDTSKNVPDGIIRVPTTSAPSSVVVVTSMPDRPINSVLLINNKRLALSSTAAIHPSTQQSINISSVLNNQRHPSSNSVLLWGVHNNNNASIMTLQQPQRLQRFQLITNQSALASSENLTANHIKESSQQLTRLNGISLSGNSTHILLGIPQKRQDTFSPKGQLILSDLEELGELQTEGEIPPHSAFSSPHRVFIKGGNTPNML